MCSAGWLFTHKFNQNQGNYVMKHTANIPFICIQFLQISGHIRTAMSRLLATATAMVHLSEAAWVVLRVSRFEVAPGGALLGYAWFSKQLPRCTKIP